jgi:hypothetical protein
MYYLSNIELLSVKKINTSFLNSDNAKILHPIKVNVVYEQVGNVNFPSFIVDFMSVFISSDVTYVISV